MPKTFSADKLHPHEPWFYLRAQDSISVDALRAYAYALRREARIEEHGRVVEDPRVFSGLRTLSPNPALAERLEAQARDVDAIAAHFQAWQQNHPELVRLPD